MKPVNTNVNAYKHTLLSRGAVGCKACISCQAVHAVPAETIHRVCGAGRPAWVHKIIHCQALLLLCRHNYCCTHLTDVSGSCPAVRKFTCYSKGLNRTQQTSSQSTVRKFLCMYYACCTLPRDRLEECKAAGRSSPQGMPYADSTAGLDYLNKYTLVTTTPLACCLFITASFCQQSRWVRETNQTWQQNAELETFKDVPHVRSKRCTRC